MHARGLVVRMMAFADVAVSVTDANAASRWWSEKMGFRAHRVHGSDHALVVAPPGERFLLHLCEGFEPVEAGNTGIAFLTDKLDAELARMRAAGVRIVEHEGATAKFADPDGNVFWLVGAPAPLIRETLALRAPP